MSNEHHHISSLVTDLVEMAQATKRLPELERELREAYQRIDQLMSRSQELERKIDQEVSINTELAAKLHAAEVARDDAGFRQLEAEDRAAALRGAIESVFPSLGKTLAALDGDGRSEVHRMSATEEQEYLEYRRAKEAAAAKQMEEASRPSESVTSPPVDVTATTESPSVSAGVGESAADPTGESLGATDSPLPEGSPSFSVPSSGGVSVLSNPTASQPISPSETVPGTTASAQDGAPTQGKYLGKRYADWPYYVSELNWIAGGGTRESYLEGREQWANPRTA